MTAASAIYVGSVRHRRHGPVEHRLTAALGMLYVDLDELDLLEHRPLWSATRRAPGRLRREDHLGDASIPLRDAVAAEVGRQTGTEPTGPIRLLTVPRTFGVGFNSLSLFYCFAPDGRAVDFVLAEVANTPWRERHCYVLDARGQAGAATLRFESDKAFHVSPFQDMACRYAWSISVPSSDRDALAVSITSSALDGGAPVFEAALALTRRELTGGGLLRLLARFPVQALRSLVLIYAHALLLAAKGAPRFAHPEGAKPSLLAGRRRRGTAS